MNSVDVQLCSLAMVYSTSRFIHTHTDALHDTKHLASIINSRYCIIVLQLKVHHMPVYTTPPPSLSVLGGSLCVLMIQFMRVPSLKLSTFLLLALLAYDVFWVSFFYPHTTQQTPFFVHTQHVE